MSEDNSDIPSDKSLEQESVVMFEHKTDMMISESTVYHIPVEVSIVLGTAKMDIKDVLKLKKGSVIELDRKVGEPVDILVNNTLIARGEIVIVEDKIGINITDVIRR